MTRAARVMVARELEEERVQSLLLIAREGHQELFLKLPRYAT